MKLISGLVRPDRLDTVKQGLATIDVVAFTVTETRDYSPHPIETAVWMGHRYNIDSSVKLEIRVVVHDDEVDDVIGVILRCARTGQAGDGSVSVLAVEHRYNICTGLRDVS